MSNQFCAVVPDDQIMQRRLVGGKSYCEGWCEITLKRLIIKGDKAELLPSNPEHSMRVVPADQLEILGKLVGIIRKV